jgi:hypothetical protein
MYTPREIKDCLLLDQTLKEYIVRKTDLLKQKVSGGVNQSLLKETEKLFYETEEKFAKMKCAKKIEYLRLNETAVLDLEQAIKSEASVLEKNKKEQNVYIALGGIVLLVGFYILIKK